MSKSKKPHNPRYAKPGTPPPTPAQADRLAAEFKLHMFEYDTRVALERIERELRSLLESIERAKAGLREDKP